MWKIEDGSFKNDEKMNKDTKRRDREDKHEKL